MAISFSYYDSENINFTRVFIVFIISFYRIIYIITDIFHRIVKFSVVARVHTIAMC